MENYAHNSYGLGESPESHRTVAFCELVTPGEEICQVLVDIGAQAPSLPEHPWSASQGAVSRAGSPAQAPWPLERLQGGRCRYWDGILEGSQHKQKDTPCPPCPIRESLFLKELGEGV